MRSILEFSTSTRIVNSLPLRQSQLTKLYVDVDVEISANPLNFNSFPFPIGLTANHE